jgi:DNA-binding CsgD family transcriptional regulator
MPVFEIAVVSTSAALVATLEGTLNTEPDGFILHVVGEADLARPPDAAPPHAVVVAPVDGEELGRWLPPLLQRFDGCPFLLWVEPCLGGMCATLFEERCCTVVSPQWPERVLPASLRAVAERHAACPPSALHQFFRDQWKAQTGKSTYLTAREIEGGCGLGLGLTDREIAGFLHLSPRSVRTYLNSLFRKLGSHDRHAVGRQFRRALAQLGPPF